MRNFFLLESQIIYEQLPHYFLSGTVDDIKSTMQFTRLRYYSHRFTILKRHFQMMLWVNHDHNPRCGMLRRRSMALVTAWCLRHEAYHMLRGRGPSSVGTRKRIRVVEQHSERHCLQATKFNFNKRMNFANCNLRIFESVQCRSA